MKYLPVCSAFALAAPVALAGPYAPAAGKPGSDAIHRDDPRFVSWASGYRDVVYGPDVDAVWKTPVKALGKADADLYHIVSLGDRGTITLWFPQPVCDGEGADFAVFENSFSDTFLELAWVEVSSDGVNFFRFPNVSFTKGMVGAFGNVDPTNISGLAGKYRGGYGTPFDLAALEKSPLLDTRRVCFIRIVDIAGNGSERDSQGNVIYDPYPTIGSAGFDLSGIGVIHQNDGGFRILRAEKTGSSLLLEWERNPGSSYVLESSPDLASWQPVETIPGAPASGTLTRMVEAAGTSGYWRVRRVE